MEVSPTGQPSTPTSAPNPNHDPVHLLHALIQLQSQTLEIQKLILQNQQQQLELAREATQVARDQRSRQMAELERWQAGHDQVIDQCRDSLGQLEQVHSALMSELVHHVAENHENLVDGDFALTDFVDRFGPRLAHLNTMLAVLRPLAAAARRPEA
jgi:small-conductance mechanosensitive channel